MKCIDNFIMWVMQRQLNKIRKGQDTPYVFIKGTKKDYPKYLMYTDDEGIRNIMHNIE